MSHGKLQQMARGLAAHPIARAVGLSLLLHVGVIGGMEMGRGLGLWEESPLSSMFKSNIAEEMEKVAETRQQQAEEEVPLLFVQVDPSQSVEEAPKDAKYYSSQNTVASNPDPRVETGQPKIEGEQEVVPQVMDVPRATPEEMTPASPPPPQREVMQPAFEPAEEEAEKEGETRMARARPRPERAQPEEQQPAVERTPFRSLDQAMKAKGLIEGPKIRQEGGVRRGSLASNLDVKRTPFGSYDAAFIAAVQARWFAILDQRTFAPHEPGKVVLDFRLMRDGRITEMRVVESTVSDTLEWICQRAVLDPSPYDPFPMDLRRLMATDYRDIRFTFYYH